MRPLLKTALYFCIFSVFYFSWLPEPSFSNQTYMPNWLVLWTDEYVRLRTAVPFLAIGFIFQYLFKPFTFFTMLGFLLSLLIVLIAEAIQFLLPNRHPDFFDVLYAGLGSVLGMFLFFILNSTVRIINNIR
jgi:glycopeptide antibiotics resistance protein